MKVVGKVGRSGKMPSDKRKAFGVLPDIKGEIVGVRDVQDRGRIQIPKKVKKDLGLEAGDSVYWVRGYDGRYYVVKASPV